MTTMTTMTTMTFARVVLALGVLVTLGQAAPPNATSPSPIGRHVPNCELQRQRCYQLIGSYCPSCDMNGNFDAMQCSGSTGRCWCVDVITGMMIPDTQTELGPPSFDCSNMYFCPDGWTLFKKRCFIFINTPKKWSEAEVYCQFDGGNLASIHSYEENHFVMALTRGDGHEFPETWIGGSDAVVTGLWMWSDGSKFYYENWHDYTSPSSSQDCLRMNYGIELKWYQDSCSNLHPFVCAKII
ncbi:galactose-specific lectin nattectin [Solea solea]|uniref:galactose-specific lectin nattectin n=1 Tax=Solea solea TaxID=90069 RepID=UPI00272A445A|nr:galactose-specific lectin nattectin [Solea solea]